MSKDLKEKAQKARKRLAAIDRTTHTDITYNDGASCRMKLGLREVATGCAFEFIGALVFVFMAGVAYQHFLVTGNPTVAAIGIGFSFTVALVISMTYNAGFLNPWFTMVCMTIYWGRHRFRKFSGYLTYMLLYMLFDLLGGIFAGFALWCTFGFGENVGTPTVPFDYNDWRAWFLELAITMIVVGVQLSAFVSHYYKGFNIWIISLLMGITLTAAVAATVFFTGGVVNPLLWFIPAMYSTQWSDAWIWATAPFVGAILSGIIFFVADLIFIPTRNTFWYDSTRLPRRKRGRNCGEKKITPKLI